MDVSIGRFIKRITPHYVFGFLLLTVCPLLFPKIGEQQYSYVQGLCFLLLAWLGLVFQIQKHKQVMVVRSMDVAMGVLVDLACACLLDKAGKPFYMAVGGCCRSVCLLCFCSEIFF